jgi:ABC-type tungstate transport system permease subunit
LRAGGGSGTNSRRALGLEALRRIAERGARFVSRERRFGHAQEGAGALGCRGAGSGNGRAIFSAGQGAARTLMVASEMDAYDLVDRRP